MSIAQALPWHRDAWQALLAALEQGRVHHAMLVEGAQGLGKLRFAERAAAALLCESPPAAGERPCGTCRSCLLVAAGSHPDRLALAPQEDRSQIDVDQVRQRIAELSLTPHYAAHRVVVVTPADALNRHAANTLLKTLEEPPGGAVFLLVTDRPAALPATVRSRCASIRLRIPPRAQAAAWLEAEAGPGLDAQRLLAWSGGAPLAALDAARDGTLGRFDEMADGVHRIVAGDADPVASAAEWRPLGLRVVCDWQLRVALQAMRIKVMRDPGGAGAALQAISGRLDLRQLDRLCDELLELRSAIERQLHPGDQLALEALAVGWRDAARRSG